MSPQLKEKIRHEARNFLIIFLYCWAILALLSLHKAFLLGERPFTGQLFAIFNAAVLGKVILLLEMFRIGDKFNAYRPALRALIKAVIFGLFLFAFRILEEQVKGWFHGKSFADAMSEIDNGKLLEMATLAITMIVALVPYFTLREIAQVVGGKTLLDILFKQPIKSEVAEK